MLRQSQKALPAEQCAKLRSDLLPVAAFLRIEELELDPNAAATSGIKAARALRTLLFEAHTRFSSAASPVEFILGYEPLLGRLENSRDSQLIDQWHAWQATLFELCLQSEDLYMGKADPKQFRQQLVELLRPIDHFLECRIRFWQATAAISDG